MGRKWYERIYKSGEGFDLPDVISLGLATEGSKESIGDLFETGPGAIATDKKGKDAIKRAEEEGKAQVQDIMDLQRDIYETGREDIAPWREAGKGALAEMLLGMESGRFDPSGYNFKADPGYQFRLSEGEKALGRSAAARGGRMGGRTLKELMRYGQGLASDEYQRGYSRHAGRLGDMYNRLAGVAGTGQTATQYAGGLGQQYGQQAGSSMSDMANLGMAGNMGRMNARNQSTGNILNLLGQMYAGSR